VKRRRSASGIVPPETAKGGPQTARVTTVGGFYDGSADGGDLAVCAGYSGAGIAPDDEDPFGLVEG
jgi:co-chaperonin GroES (HSP10)